MVFESRLHRQDKALKCRGADTRPGAPGDPRVELPGEEPDGVHVSDVFDVESTGAGPSRETRRV